MTLAEQVAALRRTLYRRFSRDLARRTARPVLQLNALRSVLREGIATQAELAERLLIDAPAASRLVARLEADGLLRRQQGKDRRSVRLSVTGAGRRELVVMERQLEALEAELRAHLSRAEYTQLTALLSRLQERLQPGARARAS